MSISPPSDIVLDVARAADPARYKVAADRLARLTPAGAAGFTDALDSESAAVDSAATPPATRAVARPANDAAAAYRGFEAMTLSTFIEAAMPDDPQSAFGSGTAGSVWKSMLSEQIANQMAKHGGIGIATELARSAEATLKTGDSGGFAPALVSTAERGFLKTIAPAEPDSKDNSIL